LIAQVNCEKELELRDRFGIDGYPTLLWFPIGSKTPLRYDGRNDYKSILQYVEKMSAIGLANKGLPTIRDYSREEFEAFINDTTTDGMVMFYAPCRPQANNLFRVRAL
jgi:protein disulfide-isomerase A6